MAAAPSVQIRIGGHDSPPTMNSGPTEPYFGASLKTTRSALALIQATSALPAAATSARSARQVLRVIAPRPTGGAVSGLADRTSGRSSLGLAERDRRQGSQALVLAQFNRQDLRRLHLLVEELDDFAQLRRDSIGDEEQADASPRRLAFDLGPEGFGVLIRAHVLRQRVRGVLALFSAAGDKTLLQRLHRPVKDGVSGVIDQLADDLAPDSRIGASLHLD
ncbi:MAG TPA: hypothetical protein VKV96_20335 [Roseiarcus sp.]|nr:hypothetical protein [Roseiarcus sp.]